MFRALFFIPLLFFFSFKYAYSDNLQNYTKEMKNNAQKIINSRDKVYNKLVKPMTTDEKMKTLDESKEFDVNMVCPGANSIVEVSMIPEGSLSATGELKITAMVDMNLDGVMETSITSRNVGGMCSDGYIADCNPPGSWDECKFYKWYYINGEIRALSKDPDNNRDISIADLHGCFCFNRSCGSPIMSNLNTILGFYGNGILNILRQVKQNVVITRVDNKLDEMKIAYIGASSTKCTENSNNSYGSKDINELVSLQNSVDFDEQAVIDNQSSDSNSPWSSVQNAFTTANQAYEYRECYIRAKVASRTETRTRNPKLACEKKPTDPQEPEWKRLTGNEGPGEWYHPDGKKGYVAIANELMRIRLDPSYCEPATFIETYVEVLCNEKWTTLYYKDLGYSWAAGCSGGSWNSLNIGSKDFIDWVLQDSKLEWPRWKYECGAGADTCLAASDLCRCVITDDIFTCYSPSMGLGDGSLIKNGKSEDGEDYNKTLYQGCEEITDPINGCIELQNDPNCELVEEYTDGVPTVQGGVLTGIEPFPECKLIEGSVRSITVCEPWWEKRRLYRCASNAPDFTNVKERVKHINKNIGYNSDTGEWSSQGDILFNEDGSKQTVVFDPNLQFNTQIDECKPACLVSKQNKNTNIMITGLTETEVFNKDKEVVETRECLQNESGQYYCPVDTANGETISTDCTCFDQKVFTEATTRMSVLRNTPLDMICSSGEKAGVCGPEDEGINTERVVCLNNPQLNFNNGDLTISGNIDAYNCEPSLWNRSSSLPTQTHTITTTDDYVCWAGIKGFSENIGEETDKDYFNNLFGELTPVSEWFDPVVDWAKPLIVEQLKNDPYFIPDPGPECPCKGSDSNITITSDGNGGFYKCTWTVETSVENINREDNLVLRPDNQDPFGDVYLSFSRIGQWGGSHSAKCVYNDTIEDQSVVGKCVAVKKSICTTSCPSSISLYIDLGFNRIYNDSNGGNVRTSFYNVYVNNNLVINFGIVPYLFLSNLTGNDEIKIEFNSNGLENNGFSQWTRGPIRIKDVNDNYIKVINSRTSFYETVTIKLSKSFLSNSCVITANVTSSLGVSGSGNITYCPGDFTVNGECKQVYDPITGYNGRCFANNNDAGCDNSRYCHNAGRNSVCWTCYGSGRSYGFSIVYTPGDGGCWVPYDRGYYCGRQIFYQRQKSGSLANSKAKELCEHPYECVATGKRYLNPSECNLKCTAQSEDVYYCSTTGNSFSSLNECQSNCKSDPFYICPSGEVVKDPSLCSKWFCPLTEQYYKNDATCQDACSKPISCNAQTDDYRFKVTIRNNGSNDYTQELDLIEPEEKHIASADYTHEDLILRQCVDRYFQPYLDFDDPESGGHFTYSIADHLIYQYAGVNGQLPYNEVSHLLPDIDTTDPIVYRPTDSVPLIPQFPNKQTNSIWTDNDSLRLGEYSVDISNLRPLVYYYKCPVGEVVKGNSPDLCSANVRPFGGVDNTVDDKYCFQNRCTRGHIEPEDRVYSGCGFVNDGVWQ